MPFLFHVLCNVVHREARLQYSNLLTRSNRTVVSETVVGSDRMACTARAGAWTGTVSASRIANILKLCCSSSGQASQCRCVDLAPELSTVQTNQKLVEDEGWSLVSLALH